MSARVLAVLTDAFGGFGGIAQFNRDFLTALADSEAVARITVLPRLGNSAASKLPPKIEQLSPLNGRLPYSIKALQLTHSHGPFEVVFCGHMYLVPLAAGISKAIGAKLWLQTHGIDAWGSQSRLKQWGMRQADLVTSVSRHTRRQLLGSCAEVHPAKIRVLPNTVDRRFKPGPKPEHLLARYGLKGRKVILSVSRLGIVDRYKGQEDVIESLIRVRQTYPEIVYLIVGDGKDRGRLDELVSHLGLAAHVRFAGRVPDHELVDHYRVADVFVMPSSKEGFGIVFLEAAGCGLAVIGGNTDGSVDALAEGAIGALVTPHSKSDIAEAICAALETEFGRDPGRVKRFDFENFSDHVDGLVRELASGAGAVCADRRLTSTARS